MGEKTFLEGSFQEVERVENLDFEQFYTRYMVPNLPVVDRSLAADWPALGRWSSQFFAAHYGQVRVPVTDLSSPEMKSRTMCFSQYRHYLETCDRGDAPLLYLADWSFKQSFPELLDQVCLPHWSRVDWLSQQPELSFWPTIFIGPKNSWSAVHCDIYQSHAWNTVLTGLKKFILFSPQDALTMQQSLQLEERQLKSLLQGNFFEAPMAHVPALDRVSPLVAHLKPGETLFTPRGWFHAVINLDETLAITGNWVNECCPPESFERLGLPLLLRGARQSIRFFGEVSADSVSMAAVCRRQGLDRVRSLLLESRGPGCDEQVDRLFDEMKHLVKP